MSEPVERCEHRHHDFEDTSYLTGRASTTVHGMRPDGRWEVCATPPEPSTVEDCGHVAHDTARDGFRIGYRWETNGDLHGSEPCPEPSAVEPEALCAACGEPMRLMFPGGAIYGAWQHVIPGDHNATAVAPAARPEPSAVEPDSQDTEALIERLRTYAAKHLLTEDAYLLTDAASALAAARADNAILVNTYEIAAAEELAAKAERDALRANWQTAREANETALGTIAALRADLANANRDMFAYRDSAAALRADVDRLTAELESSDAELTARDAQAERYAAELARLRQQIQAVQALPEQIAALHFWCKDDPANCDLTEAVELVRSVLAAPIGEDGDD